MRIYMIFHTKQKMNLEKFIQGPLDINILGDRLVSYSSSILWDILRQASFLPSD